MASKRFHLAVAAVLVVYLSCCRGTADDFRCAYDIHVKKGQIIKARESINLGAAFLEHKEVFDARECYKLCCELENCDLAQMQYKNDSSGYGVEKICYMFNCGVPSKCSFGEHDHYATISYDKRGKKLKDPYDEVPTKKATKTKWKNEQIITTKPTKNQDCPEGVQKVMCYSDPCLRAQCPSNREAICVPSYCGTCHSTFIDSTGAKVDCSGYDEETDLQSKPIKPSLHKNTKPPQSKKISWKVESTKNLPKLVQPNNQQGSKQEVKPKQPDRKDDKPAKKVATKKLETPTMYYNVEKVESKPDENHEEEDKDNVFETFFGDKDSEEQKLEDLTPSQFPSKFPVKLVTTAKPFHEWRQFVDNNPNFPYTIPKITKKLQRTTMKPTEKPTTQKPTTKTTAKTTTTSPPAPKRTTEIPKTTNAPEINPGADDGVNPPPVLENPIKHNNVSDVVVIETSRLRIIENKAVLPLAIFLVLAILLLFVVALRLRIVKSKLKRRPFATDDADYLINGMYL